MNSDTEILVAEILAKSGTVRKCPICQGFMIAADDKDAEGAAYGMATNAWNSGERGFRSMEREEVLSAIKTALIHAPSTCPSCN